MKDVSFLLLLAWRVPRKNNGKERQAAGPADEIEVVLIRGTRLIGYLASALHRNSLGQLSDAHKQ